MCFTSAQTLITRHPSKRGPASKPYEKFFLSGLWERPGAFSFARVLVRSRSVYQKSLLPETDNLVTLAFN